MPALQHAGYKMPEVRSIDRRQWVHTDPPSLEFRLCVQGMTAPIGWANDVVMWPGMKSMLADNSEFAWDAIRIGCVRLSHPAHLMLIEGAAPAWLFMSCRIESTKQQEMTLRGPFALLQMQPARIFEVPFVLKNVTLGTIKNPPKDTKLVDLVPAMVTALLNPA